MKKITIALALFLTIGLVFTSCDDTKKGAKKDAQEIGKEIKKAGKEIKKDAEKVGNEIQKNAEKAGKEIEKGANKAGEAVDEGVEKTKDALAMNDYQCPMKCEGDKVYHEPGKCPKCKMDLKKVEPNHDDNHKH